MYWSMYYRHHIFALYLCIITITFLPFMQGLDILWGANPFTPLSFFSQIVFIPFYITILKLKLTVALGQGLGNAWLVAIAQTAKDLTRGQKITSMSNWWSKIVINVVCFFAFTSLFLFISILTCTFALFAASFAACGMAIPLLPLCSLPGACTLSEFVIYFGHTDNSIFALFAGSRRPVGRQPLRSPRPSPVHAPVWVRIAVHWGRGVSFMSSFFHFFHIFTADFPAILPLSWWAARCDLRCKKII